MYYAKIDKHHTIEKAVFYRVAGKLDLAPILKHRLNQKETLEQAVAHWDTEDHWLACWGDNTLLEGFYPGCEVEFDFSSSTYNPNMTIYGNVRNINTYTIKVIR